MKRPFQVGHNCEAWCTKCKSETEHVIVAMIDSMPKRVECCSCSSQHNYRLAPGTERAKSAGRQKTTPGRKTKVQARNWQALMASVQVPPKSYEFSGSFDKGDYLDHPRFGLGIVQRVIPGGKIEVLFEQGFNLLVHQR